MKNELEYIIRYLDNDLTEVEKQNFQQELENNIQLQTLFSEVKEQFDTLKFKININENYFNSLIPKARKRMEEETSIKIVPKFVLVLPVIILMISVFYFITNSNEIKQYNLLDINSYTFSYEELFTEKLVSEIFETKNNINEYNQIFSSLFEPENKIDDDVFSYLEDNLLAEDINAKFISQLSKEEIDNVYLSLINKDILR